MLRQAVNELTIQIEIQGKSPLLVKDGRFDLAKKEKWVPDKKQRERVPSAIPISRSPESELRAVITNGNPAQDARSLDFYLPGASVRGAWRSHLEKVLRSLDEEPKVCDPLLPDEKPGASTPYRACSSVLVNKDDERVEFPYHDSCPVCRLFGNTAQGSRLSFGDADFDFKSGEPVLVDNVAISRQTGAVRSPFKALALRNARFTISVRLRNFELWHVGLLAHLFDDLGKGLVPLGSGKNKGWGQNTARAASILLTYFGKDWASDGKLRGLGEILEPERRENYGILPPADPPAIRTVLIQSQYALWRHARQVQDVSAFWGAAKPCFDAATWDLLPNLSERKQPAET